MTPSLRRTVPALPLLILVFQLAASASAAQEAPAAAPAPQLILIHGGSFLYEDPSFEQLTRRRAVAAGFVPHYLHYPLGDMPGAFQAARAEAIRLRARY